jgi:hypothetical protein
MCGGIAFKFDDIPEEELAAFFNPEELAAFRAMGFAESFFWARRPVLPASLRGAPATKQSRDDQEIASASPRNDVHLYDWGNREKDVDLPKTGWARIESIDAGRWNHLNPKPIIIPAQRGYEKKVWFDITGGIEGLLVEKDGVTRAYMLTIPSSREYETKTKHERMPKLVKGKIRFNK